MSPENSTHFLPYLNFPQTIHYTSWSKTSPLSGQTLVSTASQSYAVVPTAAIFTILIYDQISNIVSGSDVYSPRQKLKV